MANQNIPGCTSMTTLMLILAFVGFQQVSSVHILEDTYIASSTPKKLDTGDRYDGLLRIRRQTAVPVTSLNYTDVYLEGTEKHREAYMHWSGKKSNIIYILTRQRDSSAEVNDSKLWQSKDYGSSYKNVTGLFGKGARITFFYISPADSNRLIFADTVNKKLYITLNELKNISTVSLSFSPDSLMPHPHVAEFVLAYSLVQREVFISRDFGQTWHDFHEGVTQRIFWDESLYNKTDGVVHLEVQTTNGKARYKKCNISQDCRKVDFEASVGSFDPFTMLVIKEYIFVQKTGLFESIMHVSYMRKDFKRAYFPPQTNTKDFFIVNANEGQVFIAVNHLSTCNLYLSDATGQFYVTTLNDTAFIPLPRWFDVDIYEVKGINGTYIASQRVKTNYQTLISFDKGGNWQRLPPPTTLKSKCNTSDCSLHLHIHGLFGMPILSETNAPGLLLAHGNVGTHLGENKNFNVFVSRNGGWTWSQTSLEPGVYKFNILDQGSIMTAIADASVTATNTVYYSLNEGKTWNKTTFNDKKIHVDGVLNEPGITTLIASVYGHDSRGSDWAVIKLNFSSVLGKKCNSTDYEKWKPTDQIAENTCILGRQVVYERRKQDSICFNGENYERDIIKNNCSCVEDDFECDYGFLPAPAHTCVKTSWFDVNSILNECPEGQMFNKSQGYRKIASDTCVDGVSNQTKYQSKIEKCPTVKPGDLTISTNQPIAATNSDVVFTLTQGKGSKLTTTYTWTFNDSSSSLTKTGLRNSSVTHKFNKFGNYIVTVVAKNKNGSSSKSLQLRVEDKITNTIVRVPWATKVGHVTDFDIDVFGPLVANNMAHIHFLWTFGDEEGTSRPALSWDRRLQHTYKKHGNYTVTVEAINSVSTIYKQYTVQVFETGTILRLSFSSNAETLHFDHSIFHKMMFLQLLKQVLSLRYGLSANRLEVHLHSTSPILADVLLLESNNPQDPSVDSIVSQIQNAAASKTVLGIPMDGQNDHRNIFYVEGAQIVNDSSTPVSNSHGPNLRAVYIAIPVLVCAGIVTILVLVYYRKKFREVRRYSILRQRSDSDALLGGDDEDDPPLDLNPDFGTSERADDDQLDLGTGSHLVMVTGRGEGGDNSVNC